MPKTYEPIATNTVSGAGTSTVTFSSIPSTYTDLVLIMNAQNADLYALFRANGDSSALYSRTDLYGNGASAQSGRGSGENTWYPSTSNTLSSGNAIFQVMNYSNTTTFKTVLARNNTTNALIAASVYLYRSTSAITSLSFAVPAANNWLSGSTFTLYGIKAA